VPPNSSLGGSGTLSSITELTTCTFASKLFLCLVHEILLETLITFVEALMSNPLVVSFGPLNLFLARFIYVRRAASDRLRSVSAQQTAVPRESLTSASPVLTFWEQDWRYINILHFSSLDWVSGSLLTMFPAPPRAAVYFSLFKVGVFFCSSTVTPSFEVTLPGFEVNRHEL
jgi:hypothetical protein